jgi:hypothetical protein
MRHIAMFVLRGCTGIGLEPVDWRLMTASRVRAAEPFLQFPDGMSDNL